MDYSREEVNEEAVCREEEHQNYVYSLFQEIGNLKSVNEELLEALEYSQRMMRRDRADYDEAYIAEVIAWAREEQK